MLHSLWDASILSLAGGGLRLWLRIRVGRNHDRLRRVLLLLLLFLFPVPKIVIAQIRLALFLEVVFQELLILIYEFLDLLVTQQLVRESAIVTLVAEPSRMDPLAREQLGLMTVLALSLASLAIVLHEVLAQIKLQVMGNVTHTFTRALPFRAAMPRWPAQISLEAGAATSVRLSGLGVAALGEAIAVIILRSEARSVRSCAVRVVNPSAVLAFNILDGLVHIFEFSLHGFLGLLDHRVRFRARAMLPRFVYLLLARRHLALLHRLSLLLLLGLLAIWRVVLLQPTVNAATRLILFVLRVYR